MSKVVRMITEILEMDKELESLKIQNMLLKESSKANINIQSGGSNISKGDEHKLTKAEEYALAYGIKKLAKDVLYWGSPSVIAVRKGEDIEYTSFDTYADSYLKQNKEKIPPTLSLMEVKDLIQNELMEKYQEKCKDAYEDLLKAEQEESEDEE